MRGDNARLVVVVAIVRLLRCICLLRGEVLPIGVNVVHALANSGYINNELTKKPRSSNDDDESMAILMMMIMTMMNKYTLLRLRRICYLYYCTTLTSYCILYLHIFNPVLIYKNHANIFYF